MACRAFLSALVGLVLAVPLAGCGAGPGQLQPGTGVSPSDVARGTVSRLSEPPSLAAPVPAVTSGPAGDLIPPGGPVILLTPVPADVPAPAQAPPPTPGPTFQRGSGAPR